MEAWETVADADLLRATPTEPAAFAEFYRRHIDQVLAFFERRTFNVETALDLTAESFGIEAIHRRIDAANAAPPLGELPAEHRKALTGRVIEERA
jgi:DNA-directed RNA polymerase specialized sigma24 family protein